MSQAAALKAPRRAEERLHRRDCECGQAIYDGEVIRSRVVRIRPGDHELEAKCRCKRWVRLYMKAVAVLT